MIKTKIVATVGPACAETETLKVMLDEGVDVFRLNFSHGTVEQHEQFLRKLKSLCAGRERISAVMGDLCGPKIRIGPVEPQGQMLLAGDVVTIIPGQITGDAHRFCTNYSGFAGDVKIGQRIFIDDGQIRLDVTDVNTGQVKCRVVSGGALFSHKGINLPDSDIAMPAITQLDREYVDWAVDKGLDFLALSFVRSADEVAQLKDYLRKAGSAIKVIAKIEKPQALDCLEQIVEAGDGVLVARGDLGVEMDLAEVPLIQKRITDMCRQKGKVVIVATQMLQSMINSPVATRAEVSDVANAIMDYCDAVMLSGETAVGKYPIEAIRTITRIAKVTEAYLDEHTERHPRMSAPQQLRLTESISRSVGYIVDDIDAKVVVVWSQSGSSARLLSKSRIDVAIAALSSQQRVCRQMCLDYGVVPYCVPLPATVDEFVKVADELVVSHNLARPAERIVLVAGQPLGEPGRTNTIVVHTVGGQ